MTDTDRPLGTGTDRPPGTGTDRTPRTGTDRTPRTDATRRAPLVTRALRATRSVLAVRVGLVVVVVALFSVAAPVTAVVYGVPVPIAMLVSAVLASSIGIAPRVPRAAAAAHLVGLAALGAATAPGTTSPWPVPVTGIIGLSVLLLVLGVSTTWRTTTVVWGASAVLTLLLVAAAPHRWDQPGVWATGFVVSAGDTLLVAAAAVALGQRRSIRAELATARRDAELEQARRRSVEDRARIARELHDVVAHSMSVVHMQAESAPYRVSDLPADARAEFAAIAATSRTALREMRQLLGTLRGDADAERAPQPHLADLPALVRATQAAGIPVTLHLDDADDDLDRLAQLTAYRVVQEALGNVARHAPGAPTVVSVGRHGAALLVEVTNGATPDGAPPAAPPDDGGFGLAGMRERVLAVGGTLEHGATADGGFRVSVALPTAEPSRSVPEQRPDGGTA